jgi:hypothetical protein
MDKDRVIYGDFVKIADVISGGKLSETLR